ncbi:riboflavin kinase/FMN adenylyltransferase [Herbinix hemicellulosilytica]|uniref:Riboflavin biosynthesis protein n=1 Tax=Herbinix hemicellulosilytica TaxID=1564487 RepID=A0A0H5SG55_HERHM|nr:bifunctional riboflavin kinase/FAD synthetase [Herbinix hemicellulosilytica]RBP60762.1 riboflavin kinase/FMN adenylyltransferase [Herbinix hemicellulosilytica]CRZ34449.1 hypothetical protein HHT355_1247 [Herbinix hemicellulosilytica]
MKYIAGKTEFYINNSAVTLGKFDGLHLGHQMLINEVLSQKKLGMTSVMFTFLYHPHNVISDNEIKLIYTEEEKKAKLEKYGLDILISYPFTFYTKSLEPEDFVKDILVQKLDAKVIVVGNDFRFGRERRGDVNMLKAMEDIYGFKVITFEKKTWKDKVISSSVIRNELEKGNIEAVNAMLGAPYSVFGRVLHGKKIGRTLGMPTINLIPPANKLLPPRGVYISRTIIDGKAYPGMTNIGVKPTVGNEEPVGIETYIYDFNMNLYGQEVSVEFLKYIRPEIKFGSLDELKHRMAEDLDLGKKYFGI